MEGKRNLRKNHPKLPGQGLDPSLPNCPLGPRTPPGIEASPLDCWNSIFDLHQITNVDTVESAYNPATLGGSLLWKECAHTAKGRQTLSTKATDFGGGGASRNGLQSEARVRVFCVSLSSALMNRLPRNPAPSLENQS